MKKDSRDRRVVLRRKDWVVKECNDPIDLGWGDTQTAPFVCYDTRKPDYLAIPPLDTPRHTFEFMIPKGSLFITPPERFTKLPLIT